MWYAVGVWFRNLMYSLGIKRQVAPPVTTIGVGNLCAGGAGKTPHVEYLLRLLSPQYETALLSRGYRRKTRGFVLDDGCHSPSRLGDEPAMIAYKYPKITVAVCEKRVEGVRRLLDGETPPQVILLDDVFQHRAIKPTVNILLTEYRKPYFSDHIMPYGDLREFRESMERRLRHLLPIENPLDQGGLPPGYDEGRKAQAARYGERIKAAYRQDLAELRERMRAGEKLTRADVEGIGMVYEEWEAWLARRRAEEAAGRKIPPASPEPGTEESEP